MSTGERVYLCMFLLRYKTRISMCIIRPLSSYGWRLQKVGHPFQTNLPFYSFSFVSIYFTKFRYILQCNFSSRNVSRKRTDHPSSPPFSYYLSCHEGVRRVETFFSVGGWRDTRDYPSSPSKARRRNGPMEFCSVYECRASC